MSSSRLYAEGAVQHHGTCCAVLCCAMLCCAVLYCTVLYCAVPLTEVADASAVVCSGLQIFAGRASALPVHQSRLTANFMQLTHHMVLHLMCKWLRFAVS